MGVSTTVLFTLYVVAGSAECAGIGLVALEIARDRRALRRARDSFTSYGDGSRMRELIADAVAGSSGLRVTGVVLLLVGIVLGTVANIGSAMA